MQFDFEYLNSKLEENKTTKISPAKGVNYILLILMCHLFADEINFKLFTYEDFEDVEMELDQLITDEDENGDIFLDPSNPYSIILSLTHKIAKMEKIPRIRSASPYQFI